MAMSTGAKIAIGCGVVVIGAGLVVVAVVVGGAYWVKGKAEGFVAGAQHIAALREQSDKMAFTPPADEVLTDDQLTRYLAVRKTMTEWLLSQKDVVEKMHTGSGDDKHAPTLGAIKASVGFLAGLEEKFYSTLADQKMGEAEYRWIMTEVYKSEFAFQVQKEGGGKPSELTGDAADKAAAAAVAAKDKPLPADAPPDMKKSVEQMTSIFTDLAAKAKSGSKAADAPDANVALIKAHQDEVQKYALSGLEMYGL